MSKFTSHLTSVAAMLLFAQASLAAEAPLFAAPAAAQAGNATGAGSIGQVTVALAVVLAFVFVAAWAMRYLVTKECIWVAYFVIHCAWSALVGAGLFLLYPLWRSWYRRTRRL